MTQELIAILDDMKAVTAKLQTHILNEVTPKPAPPNIIPWFEANATYSNSMGYWRKDDCPDGWSSERVLDFFNAGYLYYKDAGVERVILSTPSNLTANWFGPLNDTFYEKIIGGIQTLEWAVDGRVEQESDYRHWFDREATQQIIDKARIITESTGKNIVVLENETAHKPFWQGGLSTAFHDETHESLARLRDADIEWWFNFPRILPDAVYYPHPGRHAWSKRLVSYVAQQVPKAKFMCPEDYNGNQELRDALVSIIGADRVIDRSFMRAEVSTVGGTHYNTPAEICDVYKPGETTVTFSGVPHWVSTAEAWKAVTG